MAVLGWFANLRWPGVVPAPWLVQVALWVAGGSVLLAWAIQVAALVRWPIGWLGPSLPISAALALLVRRAQRGAWPTVGRAPQGRAERLGWVALGLVVTAATVRAWLVPEAGWDAYSHWGLKAKAYFLAGGVVPVGDTHAYYPVLVPLLEAWVYSLQGFADIDRVKTLWAVLGSAFLVCLAWHLRALLPAALAPWSALGIGLVSIGLLESFWTGQADLALTVYLSLGTLALFQVTRCAPAHVVPWAVQAALFLGGAAMSKHEGLYRVAVVLAVVLLDAVLSREGRGAPVRAALAAGVAAGFFFLPWWLFRTLNGIEVTGEHISIPQLSRVSDVIRALVERLAGVRTGGGLLLAAAVVLLAGRRSLHRPFRFLVLVVVAHAATTLVALLVTRGSPEVQVSLAADRLLMHFAPLSLVLAAALLGPVHGSQATAAAAER